MKQKETGFDYLWCALYACAAFAIELLLVFVEGKMGIDTSAYTTTQLLVHWIVTSALWIISGCFVIFIGKKTTGFDIWEHEEKMKAWQFFAIGICFVVNALVKYLDWNGFKVIIEWKSRGALLFVFQYIYYIAEGFLISLVIVYGQKAFEKWFNNVKVPFGGIILGLTWGLAHIFSKGSLSIGFLAASGGFLFGTAYMFVNCDFRKALPIIILLFML